MKKNISIALLVASLLLMAFAVSRYQRDHMGTLLYEAYFDATPANGYATQRSLAARNEDTDASILRQGKLYHQQKDYDLALMSLRAYLESNPEPDNDQVFLLAATAAMASGNYVEAEEYLQQISKNDAKFGAAASWHMALLCLRKEDLRAAVWELRLLEQAGLDRLYPVKDILAKLQ
ncbi:MAG: tetratricopeptide (TPR) repeat protein [Neolewinella sp.]